MSAEAVPVHVASASDGTPALSPAAIPPHEDAIARGERAEQVTRLLPQLA